MALELLAGPFRLQHTHGDEDTAVFSEKSVAWLDDVGLVAVCYTPDLRGAFGGVIQLDGRFCPRFYPYYVGMERYSHNLADRCLALTAGLSPALWERADSRTLWGTGTPVADVLRRWTVLPDRWLATSGTRFVTQPRGGGAETYEGTLPEAVSDGWLSPGTRPGRLFVAGAAGKAWEYDYEAKAVVGWLRSVGAYGRRGFHYAAGLGVWLTLDRSPGTSYDDLRVWADEPRPASLTNPAALSTVTRGQTSRLRVCLTGDAGEPCAGVLVDWALTGVGRLLSAQSATDADGYAVVDYAAPVGGTGTADVTAEVVF